MARLVIYMDGGVIDTISTDGEEAMDVVVIDRDTEMADPDTIMDIPAACHGTCTAFAHAVQPRPEFVAAVFEEFARGKGEQ